MSADRAYLVLPSKFLSLRTQAGARLSNSWRFLKHTWGIGLSPSLYSGYEVKKNEKAHHEAVLGRCWAGLTLTRLGRGVPGTATDAVCPTRLLGGCSWS